MKTCIIIPCFNHSTTVAAVVRVAQEHCPVLVVDDGSTDPLPPLPDATVIRLERNCGKGAALRAGFLKAWESGYIHAITMDADGQHSAADIPKFLAVASDQPEAFAVGVRDLAAAGAPKGRRRSNAVSSFWFRVETGVRLPDTQCGFRCYPLALIQRLKVNSERYAYELEAMVRAAWTGAPIVAVPVDCCYGPEHLKNSHFRPILDLTRITTMNIGLVLQSWLVPQSLRIAWSFGHPKGFRQTVADFFSDHAHEPARLACAVGLGLFCGIAPIWGYQMVAAATLAHFLRLNKAIALVASNISIPPVAPFILYGGLTLGHWMFTGHGLGFSANQLARDRIWEYLEEWCVGSIALGALVATLGSLATYSVARLVRR